MTTIAERRQCPHVLVIEDNRGDATLIKLAFRKAEGDSTISLAESGEAALAMLAKEGEYALAEHPDIILLDLNLPRMDGFEFLRRLKSDPKLTPNLAMIPVIILSSSAADSDIAASYLGHAAGFITKPVILQDYDDIVAGIGDYWFKVVQTPANKDTLHTARHAKTGA